MQPVDDPLRAYLEIVEAHRWAEMQLAKSFVQADELKAERISDMPKNRKREFFGAFAMVASFSLWVTKHWDSIRAWIDTW